MEWSKITYNTKDFWKQVDLLANDLSNDLRKVRKPKPMMRNATEKQREKHNKAAVRYEAGKKQRDIFRAEKNKEAAKRRIQARSNNVSRSTKKKNVITQNNKTPHVFSHIEWPFMDWYDLPISLKDQRIWPHDSDSFYYNGDGTTSIWDMAPVMFENFKGGFDHDAYDGTKDFIEAIFSGYILFDPGNTGEKFFVYKSEWDAAKSLASDYIKSREYFT